MPPFPVLAQIYILCTGIGCLSVTVAALTGALHHGHSGGDGGGHAGHGHGGHGHGGDAGGHGHGGSHHGHAHGQGGHHGHDASGHNSDGSDNARVVRLARSTAASVRERDLAMTMLTWCNPTNVAIFATWFGATGLILWRSLPFPLEWTLPVAILGGLGGVKITMACIGWLGARMYESGSFSIQDVIGLQAEVSVAPSEQGMGEIIYVKGGTRYTASARLARPDAPIPRGSKAIICDMRDDIAYVEPWEGE